MLAFLVSVGGWLKKAGAILAKIIGSDQFETFVYGYIQAVTGLPVETIKLLWDLIYKLAVEAENLFPGKGTGDQKYTYLMARVKDEASKFGTFAIDFVLHNVLADMLARQKKNVAVPSQYAYVPPASKKVTVKKGK